MRKEIVVPGLVAVALAGTAAGCGGGGSADGRTATGGASAKTVTIKTFQFGPKVLKVKAGTTVTFVNDDAINHTVTSGTRVGETRDRPDGTFDLLLKTAGAQDTYTFDKAGKYRYYCKIHPGQGMTGEVDVS